MTNENTDNVRRTLVRRYAQIRQQAGARGRFRRRAYPGVGVDAPEDHPHDCPVHCSDDYLHDCRGNSGVACRGGCGAVTDGAGRTDKWIATRRNQPLGRQACLLSVVNMARVRATHRQRGFTIMELIITIAVLAILTTAALPGFISFIQNNRLSAQANEMVAAFQLARSEALKRGVPVTVCASSDAGSCTGKWHEGWVAIIDPGGADDEVLRVWSSPGDDFVFAPDDGSAVFEPSGFASATLTLDVDLSDCTANNARRITIENTGRVASERIDCS